MCPDKPMAKYPRIGPQPEICASMQMTIMMIFGFAYVCITCTTFETVLERKTASVHLLPFLSIREHSSLWRTCQTSHRFLPKPPGTLKAILEVLAQDCEETSENWNSMVKSMKFPGDWSWSSAKFFARFKKLQKHEFHFLQA